MLGAILLATGVLVAGALVTGVLVAGALVTDDVRTDTPIALDGEVWDIQQVGNFVVVAGNFTRVQTERNGPIVNQAGLYAYDLDSGKFHDGFRPTLGLNNPAKVVEIKSLEPAADGRSVYFGGRFTSVNDGTDGRTRIRNRVAMIDVTNGRLDRNFAKGGVDAKVLTMELVGGHLYVGGNYTNVYSFDIGRPPMEVAQHSLARFDAATGAYDPSIRITPENTIDARNNMLGVTNLSHTPDGRWLFFTHRGNDVVDANRNQTETRPGIANVDLHAAGGPAIGGFVALSPNDQFMYKRTNCGGRGIYIRDMEVSPDGTYLAMTHQGHDTGWACDTVIRYDISNTASRPAWVHRMFDSTFSLGIDDDAIYVGGHFRYMVHPNSPSPFPGRQPNADGYVHPYTADPTRDGNFRNDLVTPGYVYRAYQMGAINPTTGLGIPSWNPGSDAYKCVCAITVIDRGVLIGQDRGRVDGYNVGRNGFFDNTPDVGDPRCSVVVDANRDPIVSWTDIGSVTEWRVARNGDFLASTTGTSITDSDVPLETNLAYELRYNRNGLFHTDGCGTVRVDQIPIDCIVEVRSDTSLDIDWNNTDSDRYTVRRDGTFLVQMDDRTRYEDTGLVPGTSYQYEVQAIHGGEVLQTATCSGSTAGRTLTCSVAAVGEDITVSFNGNDFSRVSIERDGGWLATLDDGNTFTETLGAGVYSYEATGVVNGFRITAECGSVTIAARAVVCSVAVVDDQVTVSFNGDDFSRTTVRRDGAWLATVDDGSTYSETLPVGVYTYSVTGVSNGFDSTGDCGTATVAADVLVCTVTIDGDDVLISWNDLGAASYQARRNNSWAATLDAGTTTWTDTGAAADGNTYQVRYRADGADTTVDCA